MLFPGNKRFAFSIVDDTDDSTLHNVKPVYERLREYGFRTTKTVWPLDCPEGSRIYFAAETLQDRLYLNFVHGLVKSGFELAFHGATMESSCRERTKCAFEFLKQEFGTYPKLFCNHGQNRENLYWGSKRFQTGPLRRLYRMLNREAIHHYSGEVETSRYFWGDICRQHIKYVRNFTFSQLDMLKLNPEMPYRLPGTKYVNYWFSTADAPDVTAFNRLVSRERIDALERAGGVCIVSTHLGKGFARDGKLNAETEEIFRYLVQKPGWHVPVSDILDYLLAQHTRENLEYPQQVRLEIRFLFDKIMSQQNGH